MEPVPPRRVEELRALDDNLRQVHAGRRVDLGRDDIHPRAEPENEARVRPVEDEIPAREEHLAGRRDGGRGRVCSGRHFFFFFFLFVPFLTTFRLLFPNCLVKVVALLTGCSLWTVALG